jgi:hypothetical protein
VTPIASPEDAQQFTAKGGRAALDRLQSTTRPPRLIATPTGDHAAHHPAILAAIRNTVMPETTASPTEHITVSDITSIESRRTPSEAKRNHLPKGSGTDMFPTGYTV